MTDVDFDYGFNPLHSGFDAGRPQGSYPQCEQVRGSLDHQMEYVPFISSPHVPFLFVHEPVLTTQ